MHSNETARLRAHSAEELANMIEVLRAENTTLQARVRTLENELAALRAPPPAPDWFQGWRVGTVKSHGTRYLVLRKRVAGKTIVLYIGRRWNPVKAQQLVDGFASKAKTLEARKLSRDLNLARAAIERAETALREAESRETDDDK